MIPLRGPPLARNLQYWTNIGDLLDQYWNGDFMKGVLLTLALSNIGPILDIYWANIGNLLEISIFSEHTLVSNTNIYLNIHIVLM